ncbi:MAG: hypothetical protein IJX96_06025 [Clostridia bacterium]|nr:hypothetical protein [Clostridia bacterium]
MKKYCHNCRYFKKHYIRGKEKFFYVFSGECFIKEKLVLCGEICAEWKEKPPVDKIKRKQEVYEAIIRAADTLEQLKEVVAEEKENGVLDTL